MHLWILFLPFLFSPFLAQNDSPPVFLQLYYETECPFCKEFIYKDLFSTWAILRSTGIIKVAMYPYGHASMSLGNDGMWKFKCQHHNSECKENLEHTCIMSRLGWDSNRYLAMIVCLHNVGNLCYRTWTDFTYKDIESCAEGIEGNTLGHMMGNLTEGLNPPLETVPHILVNGEPYQREWHNLTDVVCAKYKGTKPTECKSDQEEFLRNLKGIVGDVDCTSVPSTALGFIAGFAGTAYSKEIPLQQILCREQQTVTYRSQRRNVLNKFIRQ